MISLKTTVLSARAVGSEIKTKTSARETARYFITIDYPVRGEIFIATDRPELNCFALAGRRGFRALGFVGKSFGLPGVVAPLTQNNNEFGGAVSIKIAPLTGCLSARSLTKSATKFLNDRRPGFTPGLH